MRKQANRRRRRRYGVSGESPLSPSSKRETIRRDKENKRTVRFLSKSDFTAAGYELISHVTSRLATRRELTSRVMVVSATTRECAFASKPRRAHT